MPPSQANLSVLRAWDAEAWGRALLRHYFAGHEATPVSRLSISPEELARAAGVAESEAAAAKDAFLAAVRCTPYAFRRHLSEASLGRFAWDRTKPPPFLAYLFFTCFAAASLDGDMADEGVFRERVRQLLGHDEGTSYPFTDLSRLWEAFAEWLGDMHDGGKPLRTLSLPDRGRMTLIGYSVRLAFPRREDRLRLREVLAGSGIGPHPTVPEAFQVLTRSRDRFSVDFKHVLDRARGALGTGREIPELQALWSAILEAAALAPADRRERRARFQVLAQENDLGRLEPLLLVSGGRAATRGGVQFVPLEEPLDGYGHLVCTADGTTDLVGTLLLMGELEDKIPGFSSSPVPRAVREGVLLFRQLDSTTWVLAPTRPAEGKCRALVRLRHVDAFLRLLPQAAGSIIETRFEGWREVRVFDSTELAEPPARNTAALTSVRCLQRVEIGAQLHFVGGVRVDGGYLGLRELLPDVHCAGAEHVTAVQVAGTAAAQSPPQVMQLTPSENQESVFVWPVQAADMEGAHLLSAVRDGRVIAPREVVFHSRGLRYDYASPSDPLRWFVEGSFADVASAGPAVDAFLCDAPHAAPRPHSESFAADGLRIYTASAAEDVAGHDRLIETIAAICVGRKGIPEAELLEVIGRIVGEVHTGTVWAMIRAWCEAGYLDCLTRRQWRGRVYFARPPRFVLVPDRDGTSVRVVLHGLAPFRLRSAVRDAFARGGAQPLRSASLSPVVPAPPAWLFESADQANASIAAFGGIAASGTPAVDAIAGDFGAAVSDSEPLPPGYECQRAWHWAEGGFRRPGSGTSGDVRIEYWSRMNGPDRYRVRTADRSVSTLSRSWALLHGFWLAGVKGFVPVGSLGVARPGDDGPQVPLPVARAIALRSGIVSGPSETDALGHAYVYATESESVQRWLVGWLSGATVDEMCIRRFAWIRAAMAVQQRDGLPLPTDLRRRLRALDAVPDAKWVAEQRVPRHLLAHIRRAAALAEA